MAAVTITPANVRIVSGIASTGLTGGATLTAGVFVYADSTAAGKLKAGGVSSTAVSTIVGMLVNPTVDGGPAMLATDGDVITGGTFSKETWYCVGASGVIQPVADLSTGNKITYLGYGLDAGTLKISIHVTDEEAA